MSKRQTITDCTTHAARVTTDAFTGKPFRYNTRVYLDDPETGIRTETVGRINNRGFTYLDSSRLTDKKFRELNPTLTRVFDDQGWLVEYRPI